MLDFRKLLIRLALLRWKVQEASVHPVMAALAKRKFRVSIAEILASNR
jgi:hypothetical protein